MKTNPFKRLFASLFNGLKKFSIPEESSIDKTGIVGSDYPKIDAGWIKGWVVNVEPKNIIIVCRHANPATIGPNNVVFVRDKFGKKIHRTIVKIDNAFFKLDGSIEADGSDIAICLVDKPFPPSVTAYNFSQDLYVENSPVVTFKKDGKPSVALLHTFKDKAWVRGMKRDSDKLLWYGDSGTPWFVWEKKEWRVVSHTKLGLIGEGPWYFHPFIYEDLKARIQILQKK